MSPISHSWDLTPSAAIALQKKLAAQVIREGKPQNIKKIAGIDASYRNGLARAAVAILDYPALNLVEYTIATQPIEFPYVPGLLSFREGPVVLDAFNKLTNIPDLCIFDAQGLAHPRRMGLASHLGLWLDLPTVGCAKTRLCGKYEEPSTEKGDFTFLIDHGETIGAVVRTRTGVKPLFVSIGHRIDLPTSIQYVLNCCHRYKLPETTRWAHRIAGGAKPHISEV